MMIEHEDYCPAKGDSLCDCVWEIRVRADERERLALALEAKKSQQDVGSTGWWIFHSMAQEIRGM